MDGANNKVTQDDPKFGGNAPSGLSKKFYIFLTKFILSLLEVPVVLGFVFAPFFFYSSLSKYNYLV